MTEEEQKEEENRQERKSTEGGEKKDRRGRRRENRGSTVAGVEEGGALTPVKVVLLGDDLSPVFGALGRQLLGLVQAAQRQRLQVLLEGLGAHLLQRRLHGAQEGLHPALQVVGRLLRLDDEAQPLDAVRPPGPTEDDVAWHGGQGSGGGPSGNGSGGGGAHLAAPLCAAC